MEKKNWYVYILRCSDDTLYTGVTTDIERRFKEHVAGKTGAKYTRSRKPVAVVYTEICDSRSDAQVREAFLKHCTKIEKERIVSK